MRANGLLVLMLVVSCGGASAERMKKLTTRASFDLGCPEQQLATKDLSPDQNVQGVTGCGKQATYVYHQVDQVDWAWVLDSPMNVKAEQSGEGAKP
jgi:hypothetical protein